MLAISFLLSQPQVVEALEIEYVPYIETTEQYHKRLLGEYDWDVEIAYQVMMAESRGNSDAYNPEWHKGCQGSIGLMQVSCIHAENPDVLFDAETNIAYAYKVYSSKYRDGSMAGWYPWGACHDGKVDCNL